MGYNDEGERYIPCFTLHLKAHKELMCMRVIARMSSTCE